MRFRPQAFIRLIIHIVAQVYWTRKAGLIRQREDSLAIRGDSRIVLRSLLPQSAVFTISIGSFDNPAGLIIVLYNEMQIVGIGILITGRVLHLIELLGTL